METQREILQLLQLHVVKFPAEKSSLQQFVDFVQDHEGEQLFNRKNFSGHITASAFIVDKKVTELLLLKHAFLNRWLQPGGHMDPTDSSLIASAMREAEEETGIPAVDLVPAGPGVLDFNSHAIPQNVRKQEASHYHHDVRFLFMTTKDKMISIAKDESTDSRWVPFSELEHDEEFGGVIQKIRLLRENVFNTAERAL